MINRKLAAARKLVAAVAGVGAALFAAPALAQDVFSPTTMFYVSIPLDARAPKERMPVFGLQYQGREPYQSVNIDTRMFRFFPGLAALELKYVVAAAVATGAVVVASRKDKGTSSAMQEQQAQQAHRIEQVQQTQTASAPQASSPTPSSTPSSSGTTPQSPSSVQTQSSTQTAASSSGQTAPSAPTPSSSPIQQPAPTSQPTTSSSQPTVPAPRPASSCPTPLPAPKCGG